MVSALFNAASTGNLEAVKQLLKDNNNIDVEIKDHTGATPLIEAVRGGNIDIVQDLLRFGANPWNSSSRGPPESYTTDDRILQILREAKDTYGNPTPSARGDESAPQTTSIEPSDPYSMQHHYDLSQGYYRPGMPIFPHPSLVGSAPPLQPQPSSGPGTATADPHGIMLTPPYGPAYYYTEGGYFLVPPPPPMPIEYSPQAYRTSPTLTATTTATTPSGPGGGPGQQLPTPPPEVTKTIPCRYYPNCRYGPACAYAHPAPPPHHYGPHPQHFPHYDPNALIPYNFTPQMFHHPVYPPMHPALQVPPPQSNASQGNQQQHQQQPADSNAVTSPVQPQSPVDSGYQSPSGPPPGSYMLSGYMPQGQIPPQSHPNGPTPQGAPAPNAPAAAYLPYPGYPFPYPPLPHQQLPPPPTPSSPSQQRSGEPSQNHLQVQGSSQSQAQSQGNATQAPPPPHPHSQHPHGIPIPFPIYPYPPYAAIPLAPPHPGSTSSMPIPLPLHVPLIHPPHPPHPSLSIPVPVSAPSPEVEYAPLNSRHGNKNGNENRETNGNPNGRHSRSPSTSLSGPLSAPLTSSTTNLNGAPATVNIAASASYAYGSGSRRPGRLSLSSNTGPPNLSGKNGGAGSGGRVGGHQRPPCMFFPSGICRNGDECRFAHILPEEGASGPSTQRNIPYAIRKYRERGYSASGTGSHFGGAGLGHNGGHHHHNAPGGQEDRKGADFEVRYPQYGAGPQDKASIAQALASLPSNMKSLNLSNGSGRYANGHGHYHRQTSASSPASSSSATEQRIPNDDDFPTLGGHRAPSLSPGATASLANGNGHASTLLNGSGKTAAQILKSSLPTGAVSGKFRPRDAASNASSVPVASVVGAAVSKNASSLASLTEAAVNSNASGSASASDKTSSATDEESLKSGGTDQITRPTSPEDAAEMPKPAPILTAIQVAALG